jgi:hypothetical protein
MSGFLDYGHVEGTIWQILDIVSNDHEDYGMEATDNRSDGRGDRISDLELDWRTFTNAATNIRRWGNGGNSAGGSSLH